MANIYTNDNIDCEIQTLLHASQFSDEVGVTTLQVITHASDNLQKHTRSKFLNGGSHCYPWWLKGKSRSSDSESSSECSFDEEKFVNVTVNGASIGDLPIEYNVEGLKPYELPVIGTYVDQRVVPGFKYRVRLLGSKQYLFKGQALTLQSIGMGYGKRITMEGESHKINTNYFYSDTHSQGYGLELVGLMQGDKFTVYDQDVRPVGKALIDFVESLNEVKTETCPKTGEIVKQLTASFVCTVEYGSEPHGLMPLCSNQSTQLNGLLCLKKPRKGKKAKISSLTDVNLQHYGICSFEY